MILGLVFVRVLIISFLLASTDKSDPPIRTASNQAVLEAGYRGHLRRFLLHCGNQLLKVIVRVFATICLTRLLVMVSVITPMIIRGGCVMVLVVGAILSNTKAKCVLALGHPRDDGSLGVLDRA